MLNVANRALLLCFDILLIAAATIAALALRENLSLDPAKIFSLLPYLATSLAIAVPVHLMFGLDRTVWRYGTLPDYIRVGAAVCLTALAATVITFILNRMEDVSRSIPILQTLLAVCLLVGIRVAVRLRKNAQLAAAPQPADPASGQQTVLIVGLTALTVLYLRSIYELARGSIRVCGILPHAERHAGRFVRQYQIFGTREDLPNLLRRLSVHGVFVDRIVVTVPFATLPRRLQDQLRQALKSPTVTVEYLDEKLGFGSEAKGETSLKPSRPVAFIRDGQASIFNIDAIRTGTSRYFWRMKRAFDAVLAGLLLVLMAPIVLVIAPLIAMTIGLPVLFWQDRPGLGGRPFKLLKFRTMRPAYDARNVLIPDDERLNALGRFLRAVRLDELPQLWNILVGEMSFVGPRPLLHVDQPAAFAARLLVRPGLTGWAQVMGGRQISAADKAALDVWYVQNASFKLDLEIFARTLPMVLFGERRSREAIELAWGDLKRADLLTPTVTIAPESTHTTYSGRVAADEPISVLKRDKEQHGLAR